MANQHSIQTVREALDWAKSRRWSKKLQAGYDALDSLEEQLGTTEALLATYVDGKYMERLTRAEEFIAKQGMEYRFAEFCGGTNPASSPKEGS